MIFSTMSEKYGSLEGLDNGLISSKTSFRVMDEYSDYINTEKGNKKSL